ncbi:hypothetical protein MSG28_014383 [Choristoneura fumiferana]|uniref:Uncharacterized protein n=1 Tax=Choristoneura fumiferana TaxID=7141 RepID=A0ACC0JRP1_CHOFU|nr:hypothetical protein MSG28_014383 [Choristoneura fumiferana]
MDKSMEMLLSKLEMKLNQQTSIITFEVTKNVTQAIDEKLKSLVEENNALKIRVADLEQKINYMEKDKRRNNLVFFGIEEKGKSECVLVDHIKDIIIETGVHLDSQEIANVSRIGQHEAKNRPVVVTFTSSWKKHLVQRNKFNLPQGVYVREDCPKEVLEIRKNMQPKLMEERAKGNIAYFIYDKLVVKEPKDSNREKRKREKTDSPLAKNQPKKQLTGKDINSSKQGTRLVTVGEEDHNPPSNKYKENKLDTLKNTREQHSATIERQQHDKNNIEPKQKATIEPPISKQKQTRVYIATLNVLTLRSEENLSELTHALQNINWDILGLSEVRRLGENISEHPNHILYYIGETPGKHGVGFLVKKCLAKYVDGFCGISERIALLNLKLPEYKDPWTIIQIYSPTEQAETDIIKKFYQDLNKTIQTYAHKNLIVMGDLNGQIGERQWDEDATIGPYTYSTKARSRNGKMLIDFAMENNLSILNSMFKKKKDRMWTWISPDGKSKNQIDFIMTNNSKCFLDMNVISNLNFNTNHRMVRAELRSSQPKNPRPIVNPENKKPINHLVDQISYSLNSILKEYNRETKDADIQEKYNWLERAIISATKQCSNNKEDSNKWMTTKTRSLLEQRATLINSKTSKNNRTQIANISKEIRENIRKDRRQHRMETIERHIKQTGGIKKAYKELTNKKEWIVKMENRRGTKKSGRQEILKIATAFYTELYGNNTIEKEIDISENTTVPHIMQEEVEKAIDTQRKDKAPGPDGISNEILKQTKPAIVPILADIFNTVITTETIPKQWTQSNIILLFKKGNYCDIRNYRPISLMSNIYKIFAKIILKRIERKLDEQQPIEQAGFRKDFSVLDHIHTVRQVIQKYAEYQLTLQYYYYIYYDYMKWQIQELSKTVL